MVVTPCVPNKDVTVVYNELQKIEKNYIPQMCRQEYLSEIPDLCVFMTSHISLTPYNLAFTSALT